MCRPRKEVSCNSSFALLQSPARHRLLCFFSISAKILQESLRPASAHTLFWLLLAKDKRRLLADTGMRRRSTVKADREAR